MKRLPGLCEGILLLCAIASIHADDLKPPAASSEDPAPFRAADGLFPDGDSQAPALKMLSGTQTLLYVATDDGHRFCHHPNLIVYQNELYCMWSNGLIHEDHPGQRVLYRRSSDGATWTDPQVLATDRQDQGICVAAGFHIDSNQLIAWYTTTGGENFHPDTALMARTSLDGKTWSSPQRVTSGFFIEAPRRLSNGRLILAGEYVGESRSTKRMRFLHTDDAAGLKNWQVAPVAPPELKIYGYTEPGFFLRPDSTIVATIRNYSGFLHTCTSTDQGRTWNPVTQTNFPDSTARTAAGNLPDGTAYIINNSSRTQFDRSRLTITFSDDGILFDRAYLLRGEPTRRRYDGKHKLDGWQYPHAVVWNDTFYVAYSINKEDVGLTRIALKELNH